ncbi:hypothetical protein CEXT_361381, partial [Caerostris extrusa]
VEDIKNPGAAQSTTGSPQRVPLEAELTKQKRTIIIPLLLTEDAKTADSENASTFNSFIKTRPPVEDIKKIPEQRNQLWVAPKGSALAAELTKQKRTIIIPLLTEDAKTADSENRFAPHPSSPGLCIVLPEEWRQLYRF